MKKLAVLSRSRCGEGAAAPVHDMPPRSAAIEAPKGEQQESGLQPLNFRISAEFRREFKTMPPRTTLS